MPVVWSKAHRRHTSTTEVWVGVPIPGDELPARIDLIVEDLQGAGYPLMDARPFPREALFEVHSPEMIDFMATAWENWVAAGYLKDPGQPRVVGYAFPIAKMTSGRQPREAVSLSARVGVYAMDTMTSIGEGTWEAVEAATHCALTAADLVVGGEPVAYAAVRPPGHHVGRDFYGGSCFLNNAALAAQRLVSGGVGRVAVIDLDAHHGNGTQEIFYERSDVFYGSVHVDPGRGWFPHYMGFADEQGSGDGLGANLNLPLEPGSGDAEWLADMEELVSFAGHTEALVVSLGVDAAADDPESPLMVTAAGYHQAGRLIGAMRLPTVYVQEGGYHLPTLPGLVRATLEGDAQGRG